MQISFFQRRYPSSNSVLLHGARPVLVDPGFGADVPELEAWLRAEGVEPQALSLIVNTHSHCDHAGGNHALQQRYGKTIAADPGEAALVNARDPDACRAQWLRQPIESYEVGRMLVDGDTVATSRTTWRVVATPGHTAGHLGLHSPEQGVLILGDALHDADIGWLNPYREGADSLERQTATIERLQRLPARIGYSGHGPAIRDLPAAFARARRRLQSWRDDPARIAWHACKRIFSQALMLTDGLTEPELAPMLLACPWFRDHAAHAFGLVPEAFAPVLVAEMLRSGAAAWSGGRLVPLAPYRPVPAGWPRGPASPAAWPPAPPGQAAK